MAHKQLKLSTYQLWLLEVHHSRTFGKIFQRVSHRLGANASGDLLEAITSGITRMLVCRKAGRMAGMSREASWGVRQYNLKAFFGLKD